MISWIQNWLQRHHKWAFSLLLAVIIVAFVFTIGNTGFGSGGTRRADIPTFYGVELIDGGQALRDVQQTLGLSRYFSGNTFRQSTEQDLFERIVLLNLADQLAIPRPTESQLTAFLQSRPAFRDFRTGGFDANRYTEFLDNVRSGQSVNETVIMRTLAQDFRIEQVRNAIGGPGYVQPVQARQVLEQLQTEWVIETATFSQGDFAPEVEPTDEQIAAYYTANMASYEEPEKIILNYVAFSSAAFVDAVSAEPSDEDIQEVYLNNRFELPRQDDGSPKPLDEVREAVVALWKSQQAEELAYDAALGLAQKVYAAESSHSNSLRHDGLADFLAAEGVTVETLPAFSEQNVPTDTLIPADSLRQYISLSQSRFYSDAVETEDGAAVLFFQEDVPAFIPELSAIEAQVKADFISMEIDRLFNEKLASLETTLASAEDFQAEANNLGLKYATYDPFNFEKPVEGIPTRIFSAIVNKAEGDVTEAVQVNGEAIIVKVISKSIPEIALDSDEVKQEMEVMKGSLAMMTERTQLAALIEAGMPEVMRNPPPTAGNNEE